mmetsp:Transcript_29962/g.65887  ORF Transcript_29962/g.65887 Transcript_29962/m.65887 type:complete len:101 (+) Transcript_29962:506-808(+)
MYPQCANATDIMKRIDGAFATTCTQQSTAKGRASMFDLQSISAMQPAEMIGFWMDGTCGGAVLLFLAQGNKDGTEGRDTRGRVSKGGSGKGCCIMLCANL